MKDDEEIWASINGYLKDSIGLEEFLSVKEMKERQALGHAYFQPGCLYRVKKDFMGLLNKKTVGGHKHKIPLQRGDYVMCVKSKKGSTRSWFSENLPPIGEVEFIFREHILRYVTDAHSLCCMLDLVELENNE
jgi:hypothetical protein